MKNSREKKHGNWKMLKEIIITIYMKTNKYNNENYT